MSDYKVTTFERPDGYGANDQEQARQAYDKRSDAARKGAATRKRNREIAVANPARTRPI